MTTIESVNEKVDKLRDTILAYHEDIRKEREADRVKAAKMEERVEGYGEDLQRLMRKNSPPPSSFRTGNAPWDFKKIGSAGAAIVALLGGMGFTISRSGDAIAEAKTTRETAEKSSAESRNELLRALIVVSRSAQSQAKSAEAMASPDFEKVVEAEREAVSVAQNAVQVEHELVQRQIQAAPSPAVRKEAEKNLVDVRERARKVGASL